MAGFFFGSYLTRLIFGSGWAERRASCAFLKISVDFFHWWISPVRRLVSTWSLEPPCCLALITNELILVGAFVQNSEGQMPVLSTVEIFI